MKGLSRLVPLSGVLVAVLGASLIALPSSPDSNASAAHVVTFFSDHRSSQLALAFIVWYAMLLTVIFAASLRTHLRRWGAPEGLVALGFIGSGVLAVAFSVSAGAVYSAADVPTKVSPAAEQALNVLQDDVFPAVFVGVAVLMLGFGLAIVRAEARVLPAWLGWLALVVALIAVIPIVSFVSLFGFLLWMLLAGVFLFLRQDSTVATQAVPATPV
jgi:hypothetical protein